MHNMRCTRSIDVFAIVFGEDFFARQKLCQLQLCSSLFRIIAMYADGLRCTISLTRKLMGKHHFFTHVLKKLLELMDFGFDLLGRVAEGNRIGLIEMLKLMHTLLWFAARSTK